MSARVDRIGIEWPRRRQLRRALRRAETRSSWVEAKAVSTATYFSKLGNAEPIDESSFSCRPMLTS
jgi:hypothetical protein